MGNICTSEKQEVPFEPLEEASPSIPATQDTPSTVVETSNPVGQPANLRRESCGSLSSSVNTKPSAILTQPDADVHWRELVPNGGHEACTSDIEHPPVQRIKRRCSVSAEVLALAAQSHTEDTLSRKDPDTEKLVMKAMAHSFLFTGLEVEQLIDCVSSMFSQAVKAGDVLIRQGDEGDNFYVIGEGSFEAKIMSAEQDETVVCTYEGRGAFGELALMYNCPRAATVQAITDGLVWGMDRATFRRLILAARMRQREHFDLLLQGMTLFASLSQAQRASITDCLELEIFEEGTFVLTEGESLDESSKFYILEDGKVCCYRTLNGKRWLVKEIDSGGFFGEVALVTQTSIRTADCIAASRCRILAMKRDAFERLMGPAEEVLKKEIEEYQKINSLLKDQVEGDLTRNWRLKGTDAVQQGCS